MSSNAAYSTTRLSPYLVLGLPSTASKDQVKEAFRKLCLKYHPDKVTGVDKASAESRFRVIKSAYDEILKGQAGYAPPPPGTPPASRYARAYYRAHHGFEAEGPVRCGGPYGGFVSEADFYKSMMRTTRNNPLVLIMAGVAAIPLVALSVSIANGNTGFIEKFKNEGIFMFADNKFRINGRDTVRTNPFSIRADGEDSVQDSYIYKSDKYKHLRGAMEASTSSTSSTDASQAPAGAV